MTHFGDPCIYCGSKHDDVGGCFPPAFFPSPVTASEVVHTRGDKVMTPRENEVLMLSERERTIFVDLLMNPPKPNETALAAVKRFTEETTEPVAPEIRNIVISVVALKLK